MNIRGLIERIVEDKDDKFKIAEIKCNGPHFAPSMRFEIRPEGFEEEKDTLYTARELRKILLEYVENENLLIPCEQVGDRYGVFIPKQHMRISMVDHYPEVVLYLLSLKTVRESHMMIQFSSYTPVTVLFVEDEEALAVKRTASLINRGFQVKRNASFEIVIY
jgi:hypothetical protein